MGDFNLDIQPDEIHKEFKILSIRKGKNMQDIVNDLIKKYVKAHRSDLKIKEVVKHGIPKT